MALSYELCCRECGKRYENQPLSICDECFSPLEVVVDLDAAKKTVTRESIAQGPTNMWRYQALLPVPDTYVPQTPAGWTPLVKAPRLAERIGAKNLYIKNAAVILPENTRIRGLRDSKQLLREDRERLAKIVKQKAVAIAIEEIDAATIDRINIYQASKLAMTQAVLKLAPEPDHLLIDALRLDHPCAQTSIIYGDSLSISIAAASVIAKVYRDSLMRELHHQYPEYGLASHKGYSTPEHLAALEKYGPTPLHRKSFRPVAQTSLPWDTPPQAEILDVPTGIMSA